MPRYLSPELLERDRAFCFEEAALRLKRQLKITKDKDLANALDLSLSAWEGCRQASSFPEKELHALAQQRPELGIDAQYVLTGVATHHVASAMPDFWFASLGARIRALRLAHGLTREEMADMMGVSTMVQMHYESGASGPIPHYFYAVRHKLGADLNALVHGEPVQVVSAGLTPEQAYVLQCLDSLSERSRHHIVSLLERMVQVERIGTIAFPEGELQG